MLADLICLYWAAAAAAGPDSQQRKVGGGLFLLESDFSLAPAAAVATTRDNFQPALRTPQSRASSERTNEPQTRKEGREGEGKGEARLSLRPRVRLARSKISHSVDWLRRRFRRSGAYID